MRDHGGNLDWAIKTFGGAPEVWLDLSTGINPVAYPVPSLPARAWTDLPTRSDMDRLIAAAAARYRTTAEIVPLSGAQGAIQLVPHLRPPGKAHVLEPTYNEHAAALRAAGWQVSGVSQPEGLRGADLATVVTPNNPDGRVLGVPDLFALAGSVGLLVVDESFVDPTPDASLAPHLTQAENIIVLRSFGKFYGLAGLRLGFALGCGKLADLLRDMAGPWPVSGPAIEIGCAALTDDRWIRMTTDRLRQDAARLDQLAQRAGWSLVGGTTLFRTYDCGTASDVRDRFAASRVWTRVFPYAPNWIRLGLPGSVDRWSQLESAFQREELR